MYNGMINIYKEKGFTSHDVVAKLRGILKQKKIGHTGTLDPDATGVLPVCLGSGTKLCDLLTDKDKTYKAEFILGKKTDTQDIWGKVLEEIDIEEKRNGLTDDVIREAVLSFVGEYDQIPPMYSALKVNGKKLYEYARQGIEIEREPRRIKIYSIEDIQIKYPYISMKVSCSKGTYIRTLCEDIGNHLGTYGCMTALTRTKVKEYELDDAVKLHEVEEFVRTNNIDKYIIPVDSFFEGCRKLKVNHRGNKLLMNGNPLSYSTHLLERIYNENKYEEKFKVYDINNKFTGVFILYKDENILRPYKMFFDK